MEYHEWQPYKYIRALTTLRGGGVSLSPFDSNNMAYHVNDHYDHVITNRISLLRDLHLDDQCLVCVHQTHSDIIKKVTRLDGGAGAHDFESGIPADALYTYDVNLALAIFHADCVPVFLFDKVKKWVAIIHAGMTGSLKRISEKSINHLIKVEGSHPDNIFAYLGPALTFAFNPIEEQTAMSILALNPDFNYAIKKSDGTYYLDVPLLNFGQLRKAGIPASNITLSGIDTYTQPDNYYSYARDKKTGRHLSLIYLTR